MFVIFFLFAAICVVGVLVIQHSARKLHKLLRQVQVLLILIIMILCPVDSRNCNGAVRTIELYSYFTKGYVRIEGKRIVASRSSNENRALQMITIDRHYFLLYDPNAQMFMCWNKTYNNVIARRNPKNLTYCTFEEKISLKNPAASTRYTHIDKRKNKEYELRFNRAGVFANPNLIRKCLEKIKHGRGGGGGGFVGGNRYRHNPTINIDLMMNIDTLHMRNDTEGAKAYVQLSKYCTDPDFIVNLVDDENSCSLGHTRFCEQMRQMRYMRKTRKQRHQHHRSIATLCNL